MRSQCPILDGRLMEIYCDVVTALELLDVGSPCLAYEEENHNMIKLFASILSQCKSFRVSVDACC